MSLNHGFHPRFLLEAEGLSTLLVNIVVTLHMRLGVEKPNGGAQLYHSPQPPHAGCVRGCNTDSVLASSCLTHPYTSANASGTCFPKMSALEPWSLVQPYWRGKPSRDRA